MEDFKILYWLARADNKKQVINFIEENNKNCPLLFSTGIRNAVVSKFAEWGDQKNIDKLLHLADNSSEDRVSMLKSVIDGACKAGQTAILKNLFEKKCQTEEDNTHCQNYLTEGISNFGNACASGCLDSVEFILDRIPETEHKRIISEFNQGYRFHVLDKACRGGNPDVVDRLLKPFSQDEIDRIFLPTLEETRESQLPLAYSSILSLSSIKINEHILSKVISPECREKIVTTETFIDPLAHSYIVQEEERSLALLSQVPHQQLELVREAVILKFRKREEAVKQRFEKDCESLKNPPSVSQSELEFLSEASASNTENKSPGTRLQNLGCYMPSSSQSELEFLSEASASNTDTENKSPGTRLQNLGCYMRSSSQSQLEFLPKASASNAENKYTGARLRDSLFFNQPLETVVKDKTERTKDKQPCQANRLTKN